MVKNYTNRTRKQMAVIAFDISNDKRRAKMVKLLEQYGKRINLSVFECMLSAQQRKEILSGTTAIVDAKSDQVVIYTVCVDCYSKTEYIPKKKNDPNVVVVA